MAKKKRTERQKAIDKADKYMSLYVRAIYPICYCGSKPSDQNGHYLHRGFYATRWEIDNCLGSCGGCNILHNNNPEPMRKAILKKISEKRLAELERMTKGPSGLKTADILEIAERYKKLLEEL